jgi:hypothetical protein
LPDRTLRAAHRRSYVQHQPSVDNVFRGTLPPKQSPAILVVPGQPKNSRNRKLAQRLATFAELFPDVGCFWRRSFRVLGEAVRIIL